MNGGYYPNQLLHKLILDNCEKYGDLPALVQETSTIRFDEIPKLVNRFAAKLEKLNISKDDGVLVLLPNCTWYPILFLACAEIGAIMSGINKESTESEINYFVEQSAAKILVTNEDEILKMKTMIPTVHIEELIKCELVFNNEPELTLDDVVLSPFSSGTTGPPKCCLLTHRNFMASTFSLKKALFDEMLLKSNRRILAFLPFYHASGFWQLLFCLLEGCSSYIINDFHPLKMMDIIEKYEVEFECEKIIMIFFKFSIDTINIVPSVAQILLRIGFAQNRCSSLRIILCGSSGLPRNQCKKLLSMFPQVRHFIQGYGMTELVVLSHVTPGDDNFEHLGSCGKLLPGFEAKIDEVNGELLLRSDAIMQKYKNGVRCVDDAGWLRTGDVVKVDNDGFYYIVDRLKDLIKVNGFQVSPTEIENVLMDSGKLADAAVIGVHDELCGQVPKAFVVPMDINFNKYLLLKHIEQHIKDKLSATKQPRGGIIIVDSMPKSASGKVQKNKLMNIENK